MKLVGNDGRERELTPHHVHLLRTALAYAEQAMRKDYVIARGEPVFARAAAGHWANTALKFAALYRLVADLDDTPEDGMPEEGEEEEKEEEEEDPYTDETRPHGTERKIGDTLFRWNATTKFWQSRPLKEEGDTPPAAEGDTPPS